MWKLNVNHIWFIQWLSITGVSEASWVWIPLLIHGIAPWAQAALPAAAALAQGSAWRRDQDVVKSGERSIRKDGHIWWLKRLVVVWNIVGIYPSGISSCQLSYFSELKPPNRFQWAIMSYLTKDKNHWYRRKLKIYGKAPTRSMVRAPISGSLGKWRKMTGNESRFMFSP